MDPGLLVADFAAGTLLLASGLVASERRPGNRVGSILVLTGLCWFLGGVVPAAIYLHRGPLVHALLAYPTGRLASRFRTAVVVVAYVDGASALTGAGAPVTIALALALSIAAMAGTISAVGPVRRARSLATFGSLALALVLLLSVANSFARWHNDSSLLVAYDVVVGIVALGLVGGLLSRGWSSRAVTGLVVELGDSGQVDTLRGRLAEALGDRSLVIGYRLGEEGGYVDASGRPVVLPPSASRRAITPIVKGDRPIAILIHDPAVLEDPALVEAVADAASIALSNVRLQSEITIRLTELEASRRRLVEAADAERRRLEGELASGASQRLERVSGLLRQAQQLAPVSAATAFAKARRELAEAGLELRQLAKGIRPAGLATAGLAAAIRGLAERSPIPVVVDLPDDRFEPVVEATLYFVCSEALTNIAKHAAATRAEICATVLDGRLRLEIEDDGTGRADPSRGSGLRGLVDRVEALGGKLAIDSRVGRGTRVRAEVPLS